MQQRSALQSRGLELVGLGWFWFLNSLTRVFSEQTFSNEPRKEARDCVEVGEDGDWGDFLVCEVTQIEFYVLRFALGGGRTINPVVPVEPDEEPQVGFEPVNSPFAFALNLQIPEEGVNHFPPIQHQRSPTKVTSGVFGFLRVWRGWVQNGGKIGGNGGKIMVEAAGFEPATSGVRFQRSPSELRPHNSAISILTQLYENFLQVQHRTPKSAKR